MALPDSIPVRYTDEEASYVSVRRVVRQSFTFRELVDLILSTTGKQPRRIREILHAGTVVHSIYRYWWEGFEPDEATLAGVLAEFPDPDPARPFRAEECARVKFRDAAEPLPHTVTIEKQEAAERRWPAVAGWFRRPPFWNFLMEFARAKQPVYLDYSYHHRADIYGAELSTLDRALLQRESLRLAPRGVRARLGRGVDWVRVELACPRVGPPRRAGTSTAEPKTT